ncbi:helix-turn-helix domain-containing protein [Nocardia fluminea]|uniref:helix-turn-helix domain-containing protein n=1 Tax=Nocardia fluminea TaxID=134984 RepID=UPI003F4D6899
MSLPPPRTPAIGPILRVRVTQNNPLSTQMIHRSDRTVVPETITDIGGDAARLRPETPYWVRKPQEEPTMSTTLAEALVLRLLQPGGQLTDRQIAADTGLSIRRTRRALRTLHHTGLLRQPPHRRAWELSMSGHAYTKTPSGQAMLDVPRSVIAG